MHGSVTAAFAMHSDSCMAHMTNQKTTNTFNTHSLMSQPSGSCSTCCSVTIYIYHSHHQVCMRIHTCIINHHLTAVHVTIQRIQSKISQSLNGETIAQKKIDFMSRGRSTDTYFILPRKLCGSYQRETYYNHFKNN